MASAARAGRRRPAVPGALALLALLGCNALLGIERGEVAPLPDEGGFAEDAGGEASATPAAEASSCTADTESDPKNCGRCGLDCSPGACRAGRCQPHVVIAELLPLRELVSVRGAVYYIAGNELRSVPAVGGAVTPLYASENLNGRLITSGSRLYFGDRVRRRVMSCIVDSCVPEPIAPLAGTAVLAVTSTGVPYVATQRLIERCAAPPCTTLELFHREEPLEEVVKLETSGEDLFWTTTTSTTAYVRTKRADAPDAEARTLYTTGLASPGTPVGPLAAREGEVFAFFDRALRGFDRNGPTALFANDAGVSNLVVRRGFLYYTRFSDRRVYRRSLSTGVEEVLVDDDAETSLSLSIFPTDAELFWVRGKQIMRVVLP